MRQTPFVILAIFSCFLWGLSFFIPYLLSNIDPAAITFGRYISYGIVVLVIMLFQPRLLQSLTRQNWLIAFWFALCGNVGYYLLLTIAIHHSGVSITALIIGILPVTMMVSGNVLEHTLKFRRLLLPILFIVLGLVLINGYKLEVKTDSQDAQLLWGVLFAFSALVAWTWYGVHNAYYLKTNPTITSNQWAVAIGLCALLQALVASVLLFGLFHKPFFIQTTFIFSVTSSIVLFIVSSLILGIVVSWLTTLMWNIASRHLVTTLLGQLIVFETIAGILYEHLWDWKLPSMLELISMMLIIVGVILSIRVTRKV